MLPRDERLSTAQFARVWESGRVVRHPLVTARVVMRDDELAARAAFVVPRKTGNAVARNKLRRRVRETYRLGGARAKFRGRSIVFLLNAGRADASAEEWARAFDDLAARIARLPAGGLPYENGRTERESESGNSSGSAPQSDFGNAAGSAERNAAER